MRVSKTERGNQTVDGLADSAPALPEAQEIPGDRYRQLLTTGVKDFEPAKFM